VILLILTTLGETEVTNYLSEADGSASLTSVNLVATGLYIRKLIPSPFRIFFGRKRLV